MRGPRLLVVDDEPALLVPIAYYLSNHSYVVTTAGEPEEAEALIEHDHFDAVILDLALTRFGREGLEVLRSIRSRRPWLPVIILSANVSPEVESEAKRMGADAVLGKPVSLPHLVSVIEWVLGLA